MKRILLGAAMVVAACGDNSSECDPGTTMNVGGKCVGNATTCSDGTILVGDHCEIDPASCQDGTVLMGGQCVDPGVQMADIEESAEPNGLGLFEISSQPAGTIMLKPTGQAFVIHGKIIPFQDDDGDGQQDPDIDTYIVQVTQPTKLSISADGLHGLAAGFVSVANVPSSDTLSDWVRFGVNLTGDTSKRELYLPLPGTYLIGIGDSRSLLLTGGAAGAGMGAPALEYYVSIEQGSATPTPLSVDAAGVATSSGSRMPGEVKVFSVPMGLGVNDAALDIPVDQVEGSLVLTRTRGGAMDVRGLADGDAANPAAVTALGFATGDTAIVVADARIDYALGATPYELTVETHGAGALSPTGADVTQPGDEIQFTTFYYDVAQDGQLLGMNLAFDVPVAGVIVDEDFFIRAAFTYNGGFGATFQNYVGMLKHANPGRYYFLTFDPDFDPAAPTDITATSTYAAILPDTIVKGTPLTGTAVGPFNANAFTYATGIATDPWQKFTASGTGTGNITISYFNPMTYGGRLDPLTTIIGTAANDAAAVPLFTTAHVAAGTTRGRILLDTPTNIANYVVKVDTANTAGATFDMTFAPQSNVTDLGTLNVGMSVTSNNLPIDAANNTVQRFLVRTTNNNRLVLTATPDATLNTVIQRVNATEGNVGTAGNNGGVGAADTLQFQQATGGFTAFTVGGATATTGNFSLNTMAAPPPYATATGTTTFSDACAGGGTPVALDDLDEGQSADITPPSGFDFFGSPVSHLKMFSNGFVSFDSISCAGVGSSCFYANTDIPVNGNPNNLIAPFWSDLVLSSACQKTVGSKLILQWTGEIFFFGDPAEFQMIIDGATDTIEFVYGPGHLSDGSLSTIGLENADASLGVKLSFGTVNQSPNTLFTPQ